MTVRIIYRRDRFLRAVDQAGNRSPVSYPLP
jgi:hypothetical protein